MSSSNKFAVGVIIITLTIFCGLYRMAKANIKFQDESERTCISECFPNDLISIDRSGQCICKVK